MLERDQPQCLRGYSCSHKKIYKIKEFNRKKTSVHKNRVEVFSTIW